MSDEERLTPWQPVSPQQERTRFRLDQMRTAQILLERAVHFVKQNQPIAAELRAKQAIEILREVALRDTL